MSILKGVLWHPGALAPDTVMQEEQLEFKDHYYTLGIEIDATGEAVESTYWDLIRASRSGSPERTFSAQDIDDLNEAYRVLTTPVLREAYDAERSDVLGPEAAPRGPQPERELPPLRVMEKQLSSLQVPAPEREQLPDAQRALPLLPLVLAALAVAIAVGAAAFVFFVLL